MSLKLITEEICRCCLNTIKKQEFRQKVDEKLKKTFEFIVGKNMNYGFICYRCNCSLTHFETFQNEIKKKHIEKDLIKIQPQTGSIPKRMGEITTQEVNITQLATSAKTKAMQQEKQVVNKPAVTAKLIGQTIKINKSMMKPMPTTLKKLTLAKKLPSLSPAEPLKENQNNKNEHVDDEDDEDDCCILPPEPPIDVDAADEEPQVKKPKIVTNLVKCDYCNAVSNKQETLDEHMRINHTIQCDHCSFTFPTQNILKQHIQLVHKATGSSKRKQSLEVKKTVQSFRLQSRTLGRPPTAATESAISNEDLLSFMSKKIAEAKKPKDYSI